MAKQVGPGVLCKVISSSVGPKGSSVGRKVRVIDRADPPDHVVWGPMWDCVPADGGMFDVKITSPDMQVTQIRQSVNATFAEDWLLPLEDDPPEQQTRTKETELTE